MSDDQSGPFAVSKWPPISMQLVRMIDDWVKANIPTYNRGDSADSALGVLAYHAGMQHVAITLKQIQKTQERAIKRTAISTTTKE